MTRTKSKKLFTLVYLGRWPDHIYLGFKKRGFGKGRWNGFGGKVRAGEDIKVAALRELVEEAGHSAVPIEGLRKMGILEFQFENEPDVVLEVHVFLGVHFGPVNLQESDEMRPKLFLRGELPYDSMWESDRHWLPLFLAGKKFRGKFLFGEGDKVIRAEVKEVARVR